MLNQLNVLFHRAKCFGIRSISEENRENDISLPHNLTTVKRLTNVSRKFRKWSFTLILTPLICLIIHFQPIMQLQITLEKSKKKIHLQVFSKTTRCQHHAPFSFKKQNRFLIRNVRPKNRNVEYQWDSFWSRKFKRCFWLLRCRYNSPPRNQNHKYGVLTWLHFSL